MARLALADALRVAVARIAPAAFLLTLNFLTMLFCTALKPGCADDFAMCGKILSWFEVLSVMNFKIFAHIFCQLIKNPQKPVGGCFPRVLKFNYAT